MSISVGDKLPEVTFLTMTAEGPTQMSTADVFDGRKVVLFAVPGAFTPTCHMKHLPGFVTHAADLKAKGVDTIACVSVNDVFVMNAWADQSGAKMPLPSWRTERLPLPMQSAWNWMQPASAWVSGRSAMQCWWTMVWSRC